MNKFKTIGILISVIILIIIFLLIRNSINNKNVNSNLVKNNNKNENNEILSNNNSISSEEVTQKDKINGKEIEKDSSGNAIINSDEISSTASFYSYTFDDNVKVRIFAVKSSDGIIRTAFNTCQVCNPSPKAYFLQNGDYFVCQNCGNKFAANKIGLEKGGCNPIPITDQNRTVQGNKIIISKDFIEKYKENFIN